jgi:hypothetical protein
VLFSLQSTGSWGTCVSSTGCGVGTSSRNVNCQSATGTLLPDAECAGAGARPASVAACDAGACPYFMWQVGSLVAAPQPFARVVALGPMSLGTARYLRLEVSPPHSIHCAM